MASPHRSAPAVHVAGTNGKTSTARFVSALVTSHGLVPGLFTSPHLQRLEQRYEVAGEVMTPDDLAAAVGDIAPFVELYEQRNPDGPTYFELTTALAFGWFAERAVDVMVVEVGLGGRLDASNVLDAPVTALTTIGLEHTAWLGDTAAEIAAEKVAVLAPGAALVTGDLEPDALAVAEARVAEQEGSLLRWGADFHPEEEERAVGGWTFGVHGVHETYDRLYLPVHGRHQIHNFAVAVAAVEAFFGRALDPEAVREAAATASLPGRMEVVRHDPPVMLDGAHNPAGMAALGAALREEFPTTTWSLVFGVMSDKDVAAMLTSLDGLVGAGHACAAAGTPRALPAADTAHALVAGLGIPVTVHDSVAAAVAAAAGSGEPVLATGSLYVVGEARTALGIE